MKAGTDVRATIPARPEFVHVLRSVAAGLAARAGFSVDEIEDLRLAVDEAAARLIAERPSASTLELAVSLQAAGLELVVSCDGAADPWPPPDLERTLTWQVLPALVDEALAERGERGPAFRLAKRAARVG